MVLLLRYLYLTFFIISNDASSLFENHISEAMGVTSLFQIMVENKDTTGKVIITYKG